MTTQMAREIAEQPEAVRRTLAVLRPRRPEIAALARGRHRILFAARGTSDNAAIYGRYLLEVHAGVSAGLVSPSIATHYRSRLDLSDAVVVCLSQSGSTEEIVATEQWARSCRAKTLAVTNNGGSALAGAADLALVTDAGVELAVPATKTYLAQLVAMAVLSTALVSDPERLDAALDRVADEVARLNEQVNDAIGSGGSTDRAGEILATANHTVAAGRGLLMGTALEIALKLEETCLRPVRGYSYADLRHGPISVVTDGVAAILPAAADGPLLTPMTEVADDLLGRGALTIGIGGDAAFAAACSAHLPGPDLPESLAPLGAIVPGQLLVERLARTLGLDPDNPRGLSKVTQTD